MGSYSGIDRAAIDKMIALERLPLNQYTTKKTNITEQQNAWKDINTRLNSLFEKIKTLQSVSTFTSNKVTSANSDIVSATADSSAAAGTYRIDVKNLATSSSIVGGKVLADGQEITDEFGKGGTFTITNQDNQTVKITIESEDSLKDTVTKINEATTEAVGDAEGKKIGITASIIDGRIVLTDDKTGERNITLNEETDGFLKELGLSKVVDGSVEEGTTTDVSFNKGVNAKFSINGIEVTNRESNSISDVVEGLTINLKDEGVTTVTVALDNSKAETAVKDFVDQYNSTMKFIEDKLAAGDPDVPGSAGTLSGDGGLMRLHSSLRSLVTSRIGADKGEYTDISQLGVSTIDKHGQLQFDAAKLREALAEDPGKVTNFFGTGEGTGFVAKVNSYIDSYISKENGILKSKNETYDRTLKDINKRIEDFEARMVKKEEQLIKKFTALDVAMMNAESQMTWLQGQVDAFNGTKK